MVLPSAFAEIPDDLRARAVPIRLACFDVDGVLTDGQVWIGPEGEERVKAFHVHDGLGLKLLDQQGISLALITARSSRALAERAFELGIRHVFQGERDKLARVDSLCESLSLAPEQVCYVGDDLPDLAPMSQVGLAIAVANAHPWVAARAHWQTRARGGFGAVREVCDLLIEAQGRTDAVLAHFGRGPV